MQSTIAKNSMSHHTTHLLELFRFCPKCGSGNFGIDTEKSKRCRDCGFTYFMNPGASTVAVIMNERNELLAVRRCKEPAIGTLDLPGGFSDCHETSEEGVAREVLEETGLEVTHTQFLFSEPNSYRYSGLDIPTLDFFYLCRVARTDCAHAMDDAGEVLWLPWEKVRPEDFGLKSISLGIRRLIAMHKTQQLP